MTVKLLPLLTYVFLFFFTENQSTGVTDGSSSPASSSTSTGDSSTFKSKPICKKKFLNALMLNGFDRNEKRNNNTICGLSSNDNCCSKIDEIKIIKIWNSYTLPKITKFSNDMQSLYQNFADLEPYLLRLNFSNIEFHFDNVAWRKTNTSQCFSGKFFLEQANYDLVKAPLNVTKAMMERLIDQIANNITQKIGRRVVRGRVLRSMMNDMLVNNTQWEPDLIDSIGSDVVDAWASRFSIALIDRLAAAKPPNVTLPVPTENLTVIQMLTDTYSIKDIVLNVTRSISNNNFPKILQMRAANIHIITLLNFMNSTFNATFRQSTEVINRRINVTRLIYDISDELFADEVLRRYFAWFLVPTSQTRYIRVFKYLENRLYKVISDAVSRSPNLNQYAHYVALKEVMTAMDPSAIRAILFTSYQRINGAMTLNIALGNYTTYFLNATNSTLPNSTFYLMMLRKIYNDDTFKMDLPVNQNGEWQMDWSVNQRMQQIFYKYATDVKNETNNAFYFNYGVLPTNNNQNMTDLFTKAANTFLKLNFRMARFAEFTGDNKRVCATVFKHDLVREAVFNKKKFSFCLQTDDNYRSKSAAAELGQIKYLKRQITKIVELKKAFYCAACSSKYSKSVNIEANTITFSQDFCWQFINNFRSYFEWRYQVFEKYQNIIYQFLSCYGRNANLTDSFPYASWGGFLPDNFTEWQTCSLVTNPQNISLCEPVCNKIMITNFSTWIEGDRRALQKLYSYALTVMRMYGIQYGTYDVQRYAVNVTAGASRLLEERKRLVVYNLQPDEKKVDRKLQTSSTTSTTNSTSTSNSTNITAPKALVRMFDNPAIKMMFDLFSNIDKRKTYSRPEHYFHDEIGSCKKNYEVLPPMQSFQNMTTKIRKTGGLNLFTIADNAQMTPNMFDSLILGRFKIRYENIQSSVFKSCVVVHKADLLKFNEDYSLVFLNTYYDPAPVKFIPPHNDLLFPRYNNETKPGWVLPSTTLQSQFTVNQLSTKRKLKLKSKPKIPTDEPSTKSLSSILSGFLFKVWF